MRSHEDERMRSAISIELLDEERGTLVRSYRPMRTYSEKSTEVGTLSEIAMFWVVVLPRAMPAIGVLIVNVAASVTEAKALQSKYGRRIPTKY